MQICLRFVRVTTIVALSLSGIACTGDDNNAEGTDELGTDGAEDPDTTDATATDTTDTGEGMCVAVTGLDPAITVTVDGDNTPNALTASCTVTASSANGGTLSVAMTCTDADDGAHPVEVTAPSDVVPVGLEVGASGLELVVVGDMTDNFGPELQFELTDPAGPVLAEVLFTYGIAIWGPVEVVYDSYCPYDQEADGSDGGFVRATVQGDSYEVFVGEPQTISDGSSQWTLHATDARDVCCHGSWFSAALVRG